MKILAIKLQCRSTFLAWSSYTFFCSTILEVCINATEGDCVSFVCDGIHKFFVCKSTIISVVVHYGDPMMMCECLKGSQNLECFFHIRRFLDVGVAKITVVIDEYCRASISLLWNEAPHHSDETWGSRLHLVDWHALASFDSLVQLTFVFISLHSSRSSRHSAVFACSANRWTNLDEFAG